jgi:hypothetical protein
MYEYAIGSVNWDNVSKTFVDAWASEKAALQ